VAAVVDPIGTVTYPNTEKCQSISSSRLSFAGTRRKPSSYLNAKFT